MKILFNLCLVSILVSNSYSMLPGKMHLLTVEGRQEPKAFTSPISLEKIPKLDHSEIVALYKSGLNVIVGNSYESFRTYFSALSPEQQSVIVSYIMSLLAERSGLQTTTLTITGGAMAQSRKSEIYDDIVIDNKLAAEFVRSTWKGEKISWEIFLGDSLMKTIASINTKLNKPEFLSGEKDYIDLAELNRSERKLLLTLYSFNLLKSTGKGQVRSMMAELEEFKDSLDSLQNLNPYCHYLGDISIAGLKFGDYVKFFNYESLVKLSTALYIASGLTGSGMDALVSIGQLTDNLREFINCFSTYRLNEEDENLFARFVDLKKDFPDFELEC